MADSLATSSPVAQSIDETSKLSAASAAASDAITKKRFLGRSVTVYEMLGSGTAADLLLWKDWKRSATVLATVAVLWVLFELSGFSVITILADAFMLLITGVFVWAQVCHFTKRAPPKIPDLKLEAATVMEFAEAFCNEINAFLHMAQSIALGSNYILFIQIMVALYLVAIFGSLFNGLTLAFLSVVLSFTVPYFYDKYEDKVDEQLNKAVEKGQELYKVAEGKVMDGISQLQSKVQEKFSNVQKKQQ